MIKDICPSYWGDYSKQAFHKDIVKLEDHALIFWGKEKVDKVQESVKSMRRSGLIHILGITVVCTIISFAVPLRSLWKRMLLLSALSLPAMSVYHGYRMREINELKDQFFKDEQESYRRYILTGDITFAKPNVALID